MDASERSGKHTISKAKNKVSYSIYKQKGHNKATCSQVPWSTKTNETKKQKIIQTQESVNIRPQSREDEVMVEAGEEVIRTSKDRKVLGVNADTKGVRVNARVHHGHNVRSPTTRKKSERIIKFKLSKRIKGEGSSVGTAMELHWLMFLFIACVCVT
ncbi:unnamed protein product [Lactuca virosa]|uniref:Uncharacterized protein n=1 Tax=Lactuca virosa TaxID=75947 RepID=A0AAU9MBQ1_9ASTR|nr:unnamed protein product [Lactuca virosa]